MDEKDAGSQPIPNAYRALVQFVVTVPTVRDRVVQMATLLILEPIFEADFEDCSYGFRPNRSAHQALDEIRGHLKAGYQAVYDADLKGYFDSIPHDKLMACLRMRITDRSVLQLIRMWLESPVVEGGGSSGEPEKWRRAVKGTPQGGVISPLLANLYLHWFDKVFCRSREAAKAKAKLVRYADDCVVLAPRFVGPELNRFIEDKLETWLGLEINREKTRVVNLKEDRASLDFLGFTFRYHNDLKGQGYRYLNVSPSAKALKKEREKLRELTNVSQTYVPLPTLIQHLNRHLDGWANYFRFGYPRVAFREINWYVRDRLKHHLSPAQPAALPTAGREQLLRPSRQTRASVSVGCSAQLPEYVCDEALFGEPDAGNPHVRFDEGGVDRALPRRPLSYSTYVRAVRKGCA